MPRHSEGMGMEQRDWCATYLFLDQPSRTVLLEPRGYRQPRISHVLDPRHSRRPFGQRRCHDAWVHRDRAVQDGLPSTDRVEIESSVESTGWVSLCSAQNVCTAIVHDPFDLSVIGGDALLRLRANVPAPTPYLPPRPPRTRAPPQVISRAPNQKPSPLRAAPPAPRASASSYRMCWHI